MFWHSIKLNVLRDVACCNSIAHIKSSAGYFYKFDVLLY